jgi:hypothetical protein
MSVSARFYQEQAEACAAQAAAATLDNRRETLLRSREVWLGLAAREIATTTARAERERARTEEQSDV